MAEPVATATTPNGMELAFFEKPWRAYTVNGDFDHPWTPEEPYGRVPSVTGINGVLDKSGPLVGWATNITYEACAHLTQTYGPPPGLAVTQRPDDSMTQRGAILRNTAKAYRLDHGSATSEAQLRGSTVHEIGENWVKHGTIPDLTKYPRRWRGYIGAIGAFLGSWKGTFQMAETITGSAKHGYAGTCDTVAIVTGTDGMRARLDYKTSRQVYARTHFRQLEAYELAAVEGGEDPTDKRGIVCLYENGGFEIVYVPEEHMGPQAFLNVLAVWRDEQPLKKLEDAAYKKRKEREKKMWAR